jgi:hypothetical protein
LKPYNNPFWVFEQRYQEFRLSEAIVRFREVIVQIREVIVRFRQVIVKLRDVIVRFSEVIVPKKCSENSGLPKLQNSTMWVIREIISQAHVPKCLTLRHILTFDIYKSVLNNFLQKISNCNCIMMTETS